MFVADCFDPLIGICTTESPTGGRWSRSDGNFHHIAHRHDRKLSRRRGYGKRWSTGTSWLRRRICRLLYELFGSLLVSRVSSEWRLASLSLSLSLPFILHHSIFSHPLARPLAAPLVQKNCSLYRVSSQSVFVPFIFTHSTPLQASRTFSPSRSLCMHYDTSVFPRSRYKRTLRHNIVVG